MSRKVTKLNFYSCYYNMVYIANVKYLGLVCC